MRGENVTREVFLSVDANEKSVLDGPMRKIVPCLMLAVLCGCVGGPTHDYYNPLVTDARYKGPATILQVAPEEMKNALAQAKEDGYVFIGQTVYSGKYPETVELTKQARRVHANHIVYTSKFVPAPPGSWHFGFGNWGGNGGTGGGSSDNCIVFMGK